uniref:arginine/serine-rich protein 1 isoform X2 n=1 Tax=Monopterus albus TaxID=43700 RepID=UPI0009B4C961|nr:arginine/serine-rich protein 1-like isoform X2 [Monopterus albus]
MAARSPPHRYRARSRSYSRSPSPDRYSYRRHSRSPSYWSRHRGSVNRFRCRFPPSPVRAYRSRSRSRSTGHSLGLSLDGKRELKTAKANAMKMLGVENLELPESAKPILLEASESKWAPPEPRTRSDGVEPDYVTSAKMSPKRKIAFSMNNSVAKPTVVSSLSAKITPRVDSHESRKPYGHWIPVKSVPNSNTR